MREIELWCEKWRPKSLEDMVLQDDVKEFFQQCLDKKEIPHLLLSGGSGTGKTTVSRILIRELDVECLRLNASDERGIDTVREKIKMFLMFESMKDWKIVFLDEADYLLTTSQAVLRNLMEQYSGTARFILSVNYPERIIKPIKSRCQMVEFKEVGGKEQFALLKKILDNEKIEYLDEDLMRIIDDCSGDLRKVINESQRMVRNGKLKYSSLKDKVEVRELWELARKKSWKQLREIIDEGLDYGFILRKLFDLIFEEVSPEVAVEVVGNYLWRDGITVDRKLNLFCVFVELKKYVS